MPFKIAKAEEDSPDAFKLLQSGWEPFAATREAVERTYVGDPSAEAYFGHHASSSYHQEVTMYHFRLFEDEKK